MKRRESITDSRDLSAMRGFARRVGIIADAISVYRSLRVEAYRMVRGTEPSNLLFYVPLKDWMFLFSYSRTLCGGSFQLGSEDSSTKRN